MRKLLLRGYSVVALVRPRDSEAVSPLDDLPKSVDLVYGDVTDYAACSEAVEGCEKVVFCATSRSSTPAEIRQVEEKGIRTLSKAFHVSSFFPFPLAEMETSRECSGSSGVLQECQAIA